MKKLSIIALALLLVVPSVFAQGSKEATGATTTTGSGTTTITWWAFPTLGMGGKNEAAAIAAFEAANPDIKVKLETIDFSSGPDKIVAAIEGGNAPDVLLDAPGRIVD